MRPGAKCLRICSLPAPFSFFFLPRSLSMCRAKLSAIGAGRIEFSIGTAIWIVSGWAVLGDNRQGAPRRKLLRKREATRNSARAASVLLKSSPKKGIHCDDIPPYLRMSGQFCTNRDLNCGPPQEPATNCKCTSLGAHGGSLLWTSTKEAHRATSLCGQRARHSAKSARERPMLNGSRGTAGRIRSAWY